MQKLMGQPYNTHSKEEDKELYQTMEKVCKYASNKLPLPDGYIFEIWNKIPYNRIHQWHENNGVPSSVISHLLKKNPSGNFASIKPDGGMIVAIKKDSSGNIIDWIPLLSAESKHQESDVGNAIERFFKNYNAIKYIFMEWEIFPYVCFGQGKGLESVFEQNKLTIGMGNDVNIDINIRDSKFSLTKTKSIIKREPKQNIDKKRGLFLVRKAKWDEDEMYGRLVSAIKQSYKYFFVTDE